MHKDRLMCPSAIYIDAINAKMILMAIVINVYLEMVCGLMCPCPPSRLNTMEGFD